MSKDKKEVKPVYDSFLYLLPEQISAKEMLEKLDFLPADTLEVWTEVNLLEITTPSGTMTFEDLMKNLRKDDLALLEKLSVKQVYACDYSKTDAALVQKIMTVLQTAFGGKLGSDTEDFEPYLAIKDIGR